MTVCVAAICENGMILGASDRMLTAGDVQFEPAQSKVWNLTTSIAVMMAGDSALQVEILHRVSQDVAARVQADPSDWWLVRDVAELYARYYGESRLRRCERAILSPLGLSHETFLARQAGMSDSLVRQLATEMINFSLPSVATVIAGIDPLGAHIYVTYEGNVECLDNVGFAAIGVGRWHANSQFMFAQHDRFKLFPETLLLTYAAKKRAEVSPGVGEGTDMFSLGPGLGSYVKVVPEIVDELERMYRVTRQKENEASVAANAEVNQFVQNLIAAATPKEQEVPAKDIGGSTPVDQGAVRTEAEVV